MRHAHLIVAAAAFLTACSSGADEKARVEKARAEAVKQQAASRALAAAEKEIDATFAYAADLTDSIAPDLTNTISSSIKNAADGQLAVENARYASNKDLYENAGGAGVAARFDAEDRMRDSLKSSLVRRKSVLERGLVLLNVKRSVLNERELFRASGKPVSAQTTAEGTGKMLRADRNLLNWLEQTQPRERSEIAPLLSRVAASEARLSEAIASYNRATSQLGRPVLQIAPQSANGLQAPRSETTSTPTASSSEAPRLTSAYLVGTWGPQPGDDPRQSCETDSIVTFNRNGTFHDAGAQGRYRISGQRITYFNRKPLDVTEGEEADPVEATLTTTVTPSSKNKMVEDGQAYYRCSTS